MRIISGEFRGRPLKTPKGSTTRPTTDRIKESMMSSLISLTGGLDGLRVLDAFAGSGALGIEALSRGAASAVFCERDRLALEALQANLSMIKLPSSRALVRRGDVLKNIPVSQGPFDVVFLDPPYAYRAEEIFDWIGRMYHMDALSHDAVIMYEYASSDEASVDAIHCPFLSLSSQRRVGETAFRWYELVSEEG